jgi:RimJ/RimL family protein N-acetyltransferase
MFAVSPEQAADLRSWFTPERPGPLVGLHVLATGHGTLYVDRWPDPRTVLAESGRNYALAGAADVLAPADLRARIVAGVVEELYEDIGVVTDPAHQGLGLSTACAAALCDDIQRRGHQPTWTTATDNRRSLRVAEKLGFVVQHHDRLLVIGGPPPEPC